MFRLLAFFYGAVAYVLFLGVFLYTIAFLGGFLVPITVDTPSTLSLAYAISIDLALLGLFGLQHSGMARRAFKRLWTKIVPWPMERSTYVYATCAALILLMWQWQGIDRVIWQIDTPALRAVLWTLFGSGWLLVLASTFAVSHADLFGLRQVYYNFLKRLPTPFTMKTGSLYAFVRHPLLLGFLVAFWSAPNMTAGHLLFSAVASGYILVAIQLEERDLVHAFGERYRRYRQRVPMLIPFAVSRANKKPDIAVHS
jgi:methanethiol S-methyltransferase